MSGRADIIVTACVLLSALFAVASCALAFAVGAAFACLAFIAACYLVLLAMFVTLYVGRGDG